MDKICIVEDEADLNQLLRCYLENADYAVESYATFHDAQLQIGNPEISVWVIDIMLPDGNGLDLLKQLKATHPSTPCIIISAKGDRFDRVAGFEFGCDDYISKPFLPAELVFRIDKLSTVHKTSEPQTADVGLHFGRYLVDQDRRLVMDGQQKCDITSREFDIIMFFIHHQKQALSREQLLDGVWGMDYFGNDRIVDNYIKNIRKKLPNAAIETIYGYGYRYNQ